MFLSAANTGAQTSTFITQTYPFLGNNHITADFNRDGKLDLAGTGATAAAVMLNKGDGTFQPKIDYPVGGQAQDLAAGDFNADGKTDLVVTTNPANQPFSADWQRQRDIQCARQFPKHFRFRFAGDRCRRSKQ